MVVVAEVASSSMAVGVVVDNVVVVGIVDLDPLIVVVVLRLVVVVASS